MGRRGEGGVDADLGLDVDLGLDLLDIPGLMPDVPAIGDLLSPIKPAVEELKSALSSAGSLLDPLNDPLEQLARADLDTQFQQLADRLGAEIDETRQEGFSGILVQISDLFGDSTQAKLLKDLATILTRAAGVDLPADAFHPPGGG
jgi:hypothetical protein